MRLTVVDGAVATNATWVAYQDDDGPWTFIEGAEGDYSFPVVEERYAVAVVCIQERDEHPITVLRATRAELPALRLPCDRFDDFGLRVEGSIAGVIDGDDVFIAVGPYTGHQSPPFDTYGVGTDPGVTDIVVRRVNGAAVDLVAALGVEVTADLVLDFDLAEAYRLVAATTDVTGLEPEDELTITASYRTIHATSVLLSRQSSGWLAVPVSQLAAGEVQVIRARASQPSVSDRQAFWFVREPEDVTLALPPRTRSDTPGSA